MAKPDFYIDQKSFDQAIEDLQKMHDSLDTKYLKSTLRRKVKPIVREMQIQSPSTRLKDFIGVSTAKTKIKGNVGAVVGAVKSDAKIFPKLNAYGLFSILEYGTQERYVKTFANIPIKKAYRGKVKPDSFLRSS